MLGGSSVVRLVCLLWFLSTRVSPQGRTTYSENLRNSLAARNLQGNAFYYRYIRGNNSWPPRVNPMAFSYTRSNKWTNARRRQDIYDGSDYDWDGFPVEDTPAWPPDYNAWPQTATQAPSQVVVPQLPQLVPTQAPLQAPLQPPYRVPSVVTSQIGVPLGSRVVPQARPSFATAQTQVLAPKVKPQKYLKPPVNMEESDALRVCSPGPPLGVNPLFRNCLIIGDSISLGYLTAVKGQLKGLCQVQHAPFAKGSGAVDSRYGVQCLSMILSTTSLEPTHYDAVVFNFGMHDIDYSKLFPEEFVPLEEYGQNLRRIKEILLKRGAQVAFALTTPVPIAGRRNKRVVAYNKEAVRVMEEGQRVEIVDLHAAVIKQCGEPPYETCSIMKRPRDVHFNPKGNHLLGIKVGAALRSLLSKAKPRGQFSPPKAPELSAREGLASSYLHDDTSFCPDMVTRCPARTTCCENLLSLTGYGCCMEPNAMRCQDSWHCCPRGSQCSPGCNFRSCKCIFPSAHPQAEKLHKEGAESKMESKSKSESHSASSQPVKEETNRKIVFKEGKVKEKKHNAKQDTHRTKSRKKANGESKHKVNPKVTKTKDKGRKKTKKVKSEARDNGSRSQKLKKLKKVKTIQKINRKVVKAHRIHQKTSFHPTTKQHWITVFHYGIGALKKHKPHIKFSHTWGKRKHQKLSFKSNRHKQNRPKIDVSMTEELKHLIVNHRKEKLRARLTLHINGHVKHVHGSHRNGHIHRRKSRKFKKWKGTKIHQTGTRKIFTKHRAKYHAKHRNVMRPNLRRKLKAANKHKTNPSGHSEKTSTHNNRVTTAIVSNILRQTLHSPKWNTKTVEHLNETATDNKSVDFVISKNESVLERGKTKDSTNDIKKPSVKQKMSSGIDKKEQDNKLNLTKSPGNSSNAHGSTSVDVDEIAHNSTSNLSSVGVASIAGEDLNSSTPERVPNVTSNGTRRKPDEEKSEPNSLITYKTNTTYGGIEGSSLNQNGNGVEGYGTVANDATPSQGLLNANGVKYVSNSDNDSVFLITGMRNKVNADQFSDFSANGPEIGEFSSSLASGLETSIPNSSDYEEPEVDEHIKVFLGEENTESSTNDMEQFKVTSGLHSAIDSSQVERSANGVDSLYRTSSLANNLNSPMITSGSSVRNVIAESGSSHDFGGEEFKVTSRLHSIDSTQVESSANEVDSLYGKTSLANSLNNPIITSGSSVGNFNVETGSSHAFGGEADNGTENDVDEQSTFSSGKDAIYPGLVPSSGTNTFGRKVKVVEEDQRIERDSGDFSGTSWTPDLSQMRHNDWYTGEAFSGSEPSGSYESSTVRWGSTGEERSYSGSLSAQVKSRSLKNYIVTGKFSNLVNSVHQSNVGRELDGQHNSNGIASGEDISLDKRNHVYGATKKNRNSLIEEKRLGDNALRRKQTEKAKYEANKRLVSWEHKELQQLLYWLSTNDENGRFKQIQTPPKHIWRLHNVPQTESKYSNGYLRFHDMLLQKIFPKFSKSRRREKFEEEKGKDKEAFHEDMSQISSASNNGVETSSSLNLFRPEFSGDPEYYGIEE